MKALTKWQIQGQVRALLNESELDESELYSGEDEKQLDEDIATNAITALRYVNSTADASFLDYDVRIAFREGAAEPIVIDGQGMSAEDISNYDECGEVDTITRDEVSYTSYQIAMPYYLRMLRAGADQWKRIVTDINTFDDAEYEKQQDFFTMGTPERPAIFVGYRNETGEYTAEFYSVLSTGNEGVWVEYMTMPIWKKVENDDVLYVSDRIESAFYYYLAGLILLHLNDSHAEDMFTMANVQMGVETKQG